MRILIFFVLPLIVQSTRLAAQTGYGRSDVEKLVTHFTYEEVLGQQDSDNLLVGTSDGDKTITIVAPLWGYSAGYRKLTAGYFKLVELNYMTADRLHQYSQRVINDKNPTFKDHSLNGPFEIRPGISLEEYKELWGEFAFQLEEDPSKWILHNLPYLSGLGVVTYFEDGKANRVQVIVHDEDALWKDVHEHHIEMYFYNQEKALKYKAQIEQGEKAENALLAQSEAVSRDPCLTFIHRVFHDDYFYLREMLMTSADSSFLIEAPSYQGMINTWCLDDETNKPAFFERLIKNFDVFLCKNPDVVSDYKWRETWSKYEKIETQISGGKEVVYKHVDDPGLSGGTNEFPVFRCFQSTDQSEVRAEAYTANWGSSESIKELNGNDWLAYLNCHESSNEFQELYGYLASLSRHEVEKNTYFTQYKFHDVSIIIDVENEKGRVSRIDIYGKEYMLGYPKVYRKNYNRGYYTGKLPLDLTYDITVEEALARDSRTPKQRKKADKVYGRPNKAFLIKEELSAGYWVFVKPFFTEEGKCERVLIESSNNHEDFDINNNSLNVKYFDLDKFRNTVLSPNAGPIMNCTK